MGGTKILVVQLKEIIKNLIFLAAGLAVIIFLIFLFLPKDQTKDQEMGAAYTPGTYYSEIILHDSPVRVTVSVSDNAILAVELEDLDETQAVFYPLFKPAMETLSKEVVANQSTEIPVDMESAYTQEILIKAIRQALAQAEKTL